MTEPEDGVSTAFDRRLRAELAVMAPPIRAQGVREAIEHRLRKRRRRIREGIGMALAIVVGGGAFAGVALTSNPQMAAMPPVHVAIVPGSTVPAELPSSGAVGAATAAGSPARPAPSTRPCPMGQSLPSMEFGHFCGPAPPAGNGLGPDGGCTGQESNPPCGPGVVPGHFYAYTVSGSCSRRLVLDGRRWVTELTPARPAAPYHVWIELEAAGEARWIGPEGSVGLRPAAGQASPACG